MHEALRLSRPIPSLRDPLVLAAFWGWNDGTASAVSALRFLAERWGAEEFATIDPDRFYDLTVARPRRVVEGDRSNLRWPGTRFYVARPAPLERDLLLIVGREPALRWKEYATLVHEVLDAVGANDLLFVGTRPGTVPHTRPSPLTLSDADPYFAELFGLPVQTVRYEGPTGIATVLALELRPAGRRIGRLTALVPYYVDFGPNPRAMIALGEALDRALGTSTRLAAVRSRVDGFAAQVGERLAEADDPRELAELVRQLEERYDAGDPEVLGFVPDPEWAAAAEAEDAELPPSEDVLLGIEELLRELQDGDEPPTSAGSR